MLQSQKQRTAQAIATDRQGKTLPLLPYPLDGILADGISGY